MIESFTLTTADADRWRAVLPASRSVTGSVEYARVCEQQTGWPARLFVVADGEPVAACPYFLRSVRALPFAGDAHGEWWDVCTPEYRGPLSLDGGRSAGRNGACFADLFARHCREQRIVAEFAHLNPWDVPEDTIEPLCVKPNRGIAYVDLTWSAEEIWSRSLSSEGRRRIKVGRRAGVTVRRASSAEDVREFHRLYLRTMERREAPERQRYPLRYFLAVFETMPASAFLVMAEHQGRVVAGGLFLQDQTNVYWHLSASDVDFRHVSPEEVYVCETILAALGHGRRRMVLGGGHPGDAGASRFAGNFSPLRAPWFTYERVHDAEGYASLMTTWYVRYGMARSTDGLFPAYRSTPSAGASALGRAPIARAPVARPRSGSPNGDGRMAAGVSRR